jgi:hypothetical protein
MNNTIEKYYIQYNYPSISKIYKLMKIDGIDVTQQEIKDYIDNKIEAQLLKIKKPTKKRQGHIISITYQNSAQMDIYDLSKYKNSNKGFKYVFALVDIFSRKAFIRPMKSKNTDDVIASLEDIIIKDKYKPSSIISDTDKAFISNGTQQLFKKYDILHNTVIARDDHRSLGIIDRFALTLKTILNKLFLINKNSKWIDEISSIVDRYNNTPHSSLDDLTPNEGTHPDNQYNISVINSNKMNNKNTKPLFIDGDIVRIRINKTFRKGTEPRYSNEIYIVNSVQGQRVTLSNGKTLLESELLKVNDIATTLNDNPIDVVNKSNRIERQLTKAGVDQSTIIESKRQRKPNKIYLD